MCIWETVYYLGIPLPFLSLRWIQNHWSLCCPLTMGVHCFNDEAGCVWTVFFIWCLWGDSPNNGVLEFPDSPWKWHQRSWVWLVVRSHRGEGNSGLVLAAVMLVQEEQMHAQENAAHWWEHCNTLKYHKIASDYTYTISTSMSFSKGVNMMMHHQVTQMYHH